jgi:hypothetical protein
MSGDDKFDDFLLREAASYNRPREVPRDAMWEAIRARRTGNAGESALGSRPSAPGSTAPVVSSETRQRRILAFPHARRWGLAAAAVLLLAIGIGIGRVMPSNETTQLADDAPVRVPPGPGGPPPQEQQLATGETTSPAPDQGTRPSAERRSPSVASPASTTDRQLASATEAGVSGPGAESRVPRALSPRTEASSPSAHQFALQQHLAHSEALLVAFRAEMREGRMDADLSRWARDLLSSTRLLLDSPAGGDPRRRRMLEDLELVLVQIVHLAPDAPAEERDDVGRAIEQGDVLTRLRTTVPAGAVSSGT